MILRILWAVLSLGFSALFITSCDFGSEPQAIQEPGQVEDYFPLGAGSTWLYGFYDLQGNPKLDADGDPVTAYYGVNSLIEQGGQTYYMMTADPQNFDGDEYYMMWLVGGFRSPPEVADLNDPVVFSGAQLLEVYDVSLYSNPPVVFGEPVIKEGNAITISFYHEQPFEPFRDYELTLYLSGVAGWPGGVDPFGEPYLGFCWEFQGGLEHEFRTLAELYQPPQNLYKFCAANGRLYRFDEHVMQPDLSNSDSCRILLQEPLEVGNIWIAETQPCWNINHPIITYEAEIVWRGKTMVGDTEYADVIEVDYRTDYVGYEARLWFARGVGCIKMQSDGVRAELLNYNP